MPCTGSFQQQIVKLPAPHQLAMVFAPIDFHNDPVFLCVLHACHMLYYNNDLEYPMNFTFLTLTWCHHIITTRARHCPHLTTAYLALQAAVHSVRDVQYDHVRALRHVHQTHANMTSAHHFHQFLTTNGFDMSLDFRTGLPSWTTYHTLTGFTGISMLSICEFAAHSTDVLTANQLLALTCQRHLQALRDLRPLAMFVATAMHSVLVSYLDLCDRLNECVVADLLHPPTPSDTDLPLIPDVPLL
jgi:hypothetical protein